MLTLAEPHRTPPPENYAILLDNFFYVYSLYVLLWLFDIANYLYLTHIDESSGSAYGEDIKPSYSLAILKSLFVSWSLAIFILVFGIMVKAYLRSILSENNIFYP